MSQVTIDAAKHIGDALVVHGRVRSARGKTLTIEFADPAVTRRVAALLELVGAQRVNAAVDDRGIIVPVGHGEVLGQ